jgi:hypothetical protein
VIAEHAAWLAAGVASDGSRRMAGARHNIKPYPIGERPSGSINVTDPDSRNLKTPRGWVQGLQRPSRRHRRADHRRRRHQHRVAGHRQPGSDD